MEELSRPFSSEPSTHVKHLLERVETQRRNDHFCDVTVLVKDKYFKAHKVLLTASSPFFRKLLSSGLKESHEDVIKIELDEATEDVMEEVLSYIYTGGVLITDKRAHNLIATADYLLLPGLKTLASNFIQNNVTPKNCIFNFYFAEKYDCKELKEKACEVVTSNFTMVMETEGFLRLQANEVSDWISRDDIIVGAEEEVLHGIVKWVSYDKGEREAHFTELLHHICLQSIPGDFLLKEIVQEVLFSQNAEFALKFVLDAMKLKSQNSTDGQISKEYRKCLETYKDGIFVCGGKKALAYFPTEDKWCKLRDAAFDYKRHCLIQWKDKIHIFCEESNTVGESEAFRQHYQPNINSWGFIQSDQINAINRCVIFKDDLYVLSCKVNSEQKMYCYDAKTNCWNEVDPPSHEQSNPCVVASDQHLYLIGGGCDFGPCLSRSTRFDPTHNTWKDIANINEPRHSACGAAMNGQVYIAGGTKSNENQVLSSCEMYSPLSNEWQVIGCLKKARFNASMVCLEGKLYVFGGKGGSRGQLYNYFSRVLTIEELDSESRAWTVKSVVPVDNFETPEENKNKREYKACFANFSKRVIDGLRPLN
ncbi:kelch-like protein diablo [Acropora millepora]|uniref:kelch-like protein diablo n=1 Tax=Acropora millepora TaxID=45264 RepID=UPI001CF53130|nr:kelch-like protein diablo [Acropora millepora]